MNESKNDTSWISQAGEDLFSFAIERDDVKWLMEQLSPGSQVKLPTFEYELQILKIISVGWSIAYHLESAPEHKAALGDYFWSTVNGFSKELSHTTGLMTGLDIDYFQLIKERLDLYVKAMHDAPKASEPAAQIGPVLARLCGKQDDIFAAMAGSKMFANAVLRTRQYFEALKLC